jgi:hypothetical protein
MCYREPSERKVLFLPLSLSLSLSLSGVTNRDCHTLSRVTMLHGIFVAGFDYARGAVRPGRGHDTLLDSELSNRRRRSQSGRPPWSDVRE